VLVRRVYFGTDSSTEDVCTVLAIFYKDDNYLMTISPYDEERGDIFNRDNPKEYQLNIDADHVDIYYRNVETEKYVIINDTKITLPPNEIPDDWACVSVDLAEITPTPPSVSQKAGKILMATVPLLALGYIVVKR